MWKTEGQDEHGGARQCAEELEGTAGHSGAQRGTGGTSALICSPSYLLSQESQRTEPLSTQYLLVSEPV